MCVQLSAAPRGEGPMARTPADLRGFLVPSSFSLALNRSSAPPSSSFEIPQAQAPGSLAILDTSSWQLSDVSVVSPLSLPREVPSVLTHTT